MNINHSYRLKLAFCAAGLALLISAATSVRAAEQSWQTDFTQASQQAAQQHKYMLLDLRDPIGALGASKWTRKSSANRNSRISP